MYYLNHESSVEGFLLTYPEAKQLDYDSIINSTILGADAIYLDDSTNKKETPNNSRGLKYIMRRDRDSNPGDSYPSTD